MNSVCLTASWICTNSFRNCSFSCASFKSDDFVMAFGWNATDEFGRRRFLGTNDESSESVGGAELSCAGVLERDAAAGVVKLLVLPSSSFSSSPNDNTAFFSGFFFFLNTAGVEESLHLDGQHPFSIVSARAGRLTARPESQLHWPEVCCLVCLSPSAPMPLPVSCGSRTDEQVRQSVLSRGPRRYVPAMRSGGLEWMSATASATCLNPPLLISCWYLEEEGEWKWSREAGNVLGTCKWRKRSALRHNPLHDRNFTLTQTHLSTLNAQSLNKRARCRTLATFQTRKSHFTLSMITSHRPPGPHNLHPKTTTEVNGANHQHPPTTYRPNP